ncbi:MAG: hypothetical protein ACTSUO_05875 [Candidatus Thorarchaeota archaeon]
MSKVYFIDAGALLTNWTQKHPDFVFITTISIFEELHNRPSRQRASNLILIGQLSIGSTSSAWIKKVESKSAGLGDKQTLSHNDIELIALALEKKMTGILPVIVSTDFAVLNTATGLGLQIIDPTNRMKYAITWVLKCPACENEEPAASRNIECPVCGTEMRRKAASRTRIRKSE